MRGSHQNGLTNAVLYTLLGSTQLPVLSVANRSNDEHITLPGASFFPFAVTEWPIVGYYALPTPHRTVLTLPSYEDGF